MGGRSGLPVLVDLEASALCLRCRIEDRGTPLPGDTLPGGSLPATDPVAHEKWPEGGFGWALLRRLTDDLTYHRAWRLEKKKKTGFASRSPDRVATRPTAQPQGWRPLGDRPLSANFCRQNKEMPYCAPISAANRCDIYWRSCRGFPRRRVYQAPTQCATSRSLPQPLPNTTLKHALAVGVRTRSLRVGYPSGGTECAISIIRAGPRSTRKTACARPRTLWRRKSRSISFQAGGNAVDAAIAGSVLLGLCEPAMTGIGGDCFALVKPAGSEEIIALNGSGARACRAVRGRDAGCRP